MAAATVPMDSTLIQGHEPVSAFVPVEMYLTTAYRPDCEFLEGTVKERNLGEQPHASVQKFFIKFLAALEEQGKFLVFPEQRVQVSALRYRVPDVCVVRSATPFEPIVQTPPLLCIEILSRDDRMTEMQERMEDYLAMGVSSVWLIDPRRRKVFCVGPDSRLRPETNELIIPESDIRVPVPEVFRELDRLEAGLGLPEQAKE